jgi:hypothetical protein
VARALTLRGEWVLLYVHDHPGATMKEISENSPIDLAKTAEYEERHPHLDWSIPSVEYPVVQQQMKRLLDMGCVRREGCARYGYAHFFVAWPENEDSFERKLRGGPVAAA